MKSIEYTLKLEKKDIDFINKILEACEGIAILRSKITDGVVKMYTTTYYKEELEKVIESLRKYGLNIEIISKDEFKGEL